MTDVARAGAAGAGGVPRARAGDARHQGRRAARDGRRPAGAAPTRCSAANAEDVAAREDAGTAANMVDRLRLTGERVAAMAEGLRDLAAAARPGRRGGPRQHAGQRARAAAGAGAVRRGRDDLRGPAQRHRRRRRHLPQVRQRRAAARQRQRRAPATPRSSRSCATPSTAPGCRPTCVQLVPADSRETRQGADARPRPGRRARSRAGEPA